LTVRGPFLKKTKTLEMTGFGVLVSAPVGMEMADVEVAGQKVLWGVIRDGAR